MTITEIRERGFDIDDSGRVIDDMGHEWRNEQGNVEYLEGDCPLCSSKLVMGQCPNGGCDVNLHDILNNIK